MSAGQTNRSDSEIISEAAGHNRGDVALGLAPDFDPASLVNRIKTNIGPNDLINRNNPTHNYQFTWCDFSDADYFADCKDDGYKVVVESEWVKNRWEWDTPDHQKMKWNTSRLLVHREAFLMYRDETLWRKQQAQRLQIAENAIESIYDKGIDDGLRHGMSVEGEYAGKQIDVRAPKRRVTVT